jgi:hypothetical protein
VHTNANATTVSLDDKVVAFPNPAKDVINLVTDNVNINQITLLDLQGREVLHMYPDANQSYIRIPAGSLSAGMYIAQLQTNEGVVTKKLTITK